MHFIMVIYCLYHTFTELLGENAGGQGAALGFQYFGGPVVTVLASKTSSKLFIFLHIKDVEVLNKNSTIALLV